MGKANPRKAAKIAILSFFAEKPEANFVEIMRHVCKLFPMKEETVHKHLKDLVEAGILDKQVIGRPHPSIYRLKVSPHEATQKVLQKK